MNLDTDSVRDWAESILRQLDAPPGHTLDVTPAESADAPGLASGPAGFTSSLRTHGGVSSRAQGTPEDDVTVVRVTLEYADEASTSVLVDLAMSEDDAVALLADQLQDSVLENTGGSPAPPCPVPRHTHPATARVVNGTASWVCPRNSTSRPILPTP
ncbi:hypothetical protein ACIOJD_19685 [Streptomyces sp. NPDC088116]|uniref:hypothetical protein n=1 Tax=Streptomyces sp. NPDC088116 TaxID=3365825 RepID=UPI0037FF8F98